MMQSHINNKKNKKYYKSLMGFTLVEVIVAMVILALVVAGLLSVFLSSRRFVVRAKRRLLAINLARQQVEGLRNYVRKDQWDCIMDEGCALGLGESTPIIFNYDNINYSRKFKVENVAGQDYRKVTIEVTWQEPNI